MTEDKTIFSSFTPKKGGFILYGDNKKRRIIYSSIIGKYLSPIK